MQKIIYITDYKNHSKGEIEHVSNNVAHGLFELGVAKHYKNTDELLYGRATDKLLYKKETIAERKVRERAERRARQRIGRATEDKMMRANEPTKKEDESKYETK